MPIQTHAGMGGGRGASPKIPPANQPGLVGWTKIPPRMMWDNDGWTCCYRGPYFIEDQEGPCSNVLTCPYSHWRPIHTVKPANAARICLLDDVLHPRNSARGPGEGESFADFLLGSLPWQQNCQTSEGGVEVHSAFMMVKKSNKRQRQERSREITLETTATQINKDTALPQKRAVWVAERGRTEEFRSLQQRGRENEEKVRAAEAAGVRMNLMELQAIRTHQPISAVRDMHFLGLMKTFQATGDARQYLDNVLIQRDYMPPNSGEIIHRPVEVSNMEEVDEDDTHLFSQPISSSSVGISNEPVVLMQHEEEEAEVQFSDQPYACARLWRKLLRVDGLNFLNNDQMVRVISMAALDFGAQHPFTTGMMDDRDAQNDAVIASLPPSMFPPENSLRPPAWKHGFCQHTRMLDKLEKALVAHSSKVKGGVTT